MGNLYQQQALGRKVDFAVPRMWYGNVQAEHTPTLMTKREEKRGERCLSLAQAGFSSYLCRLCTTC